MYKKSIFLLMIVMYNFYTFACDEPDCDQPSIALKLITPSELEVIKTFEKIKSAHVSLNLFSGRKGGTLILNTIGYNLPQSRLRTIYEHWRTLQENELSTWYFSYATSEGKQLLREFISIKTPRKFTLDELQKELDSSDQSGSTNTKTQSSQHPSKFDKNSFLRHESSPVIKENSYSYKSILALCFISAIAIITALRFSKTI